MKPCINVDCIGYKIKNGYDGNSGDNCNKWLHYKDVISCPKYTDTKKASAWEMLNRLIEKYEKRFINKIFEYVNRSGFYKYNNLTTDTMPFDYISTVFLYQFILKYNEQESIKIMTEIEGELNK